MKVLVAAVGRLKAGPEQALAERYLEAASNFGRQVRLGPLTVAEMPESRASDAPTRCADEARRLLKLTADTSVRVVLSEQGKSLTSQEFADWLAARRDQGCAAMSFLIGGPDGHGDDVQKAADLTLSLGPMTLPHGLARIVLLEQLYRVATLLAGHPYHRA